MRLPGGTVPTAGIGVPPASGAGVPTGFLDYSDFVFLAESVSGGGQSVAGAGGGQSALAVTLSKTWEVNLPQQCSFFVGGDLRAIASFPRPVQGTEVWIDSTTFPAFFTGYITSETEVVPVGEADNPDGTKTPLYGYRCDCHGSEVLLDMNRIGIIPPFTNKTIGDIIAALGDYLIPGRFDWTAVKGFGSVIPVYRTSPDQRFSDVVKDLISNQATKVWFVRYVAFIAHYTDNVALEYTIADTDPLYNPYDLTIKPLQSAIVNDVTGIGDTEAQCYCREYTLGDGITTSYGLKLPVYGTLGRPIVADDFSSGAFDPSIWAPFGVGVNDSSDPSGVFQFSNGRLNVIGGLGLNATKLLLQEGIEIKGQINIDAGEYQFIGAADAIVGGAYLTEVASLAQCKYGFRLTGGGGIINIQAIVDGALVGDIVITKPNMTYSMRIHISTPTAKTTLPPWYSTGSAFGGGTKTAPVTAAFLVEEYSQLAVRLPNRFNIFNVTQTGVPAFLFIAAFSVNNADFVVNYFQITTPIQGTLVTQLVSDQNPTTRVLGFVGENDADATITTTQEHEALTFFQETRPVLRQRNMFVYRSAGPAIARVISPPSIALEALRYRDSGIRSAVLTNLNPLPATSEELEWALQAYLDDNDTQQFEGSWIAIVPPQVIGGVGSPPVAPTFTFGGVISGAMEEPMPGRFINVNCPGRTPEIGAFSELVKVVTTTCVAESDNGTVENFEVNFDYGLVVTREMEKVLNRFSRVDPPGVAVMRQVTSIPPVDTALVGLNFIGDVTNVTLVDRDAGNLYFDAGQNLTSGQQLEVRYSDASWGQTAGVNLIGRFSTRIFAIARKRRDLFFYVKLIHS
jgi:hypothetical protein